MILGQVEESGAVEIVATADSSTVADFTPAPEATTTEGTPGFGILLSVLAIRVVLVYRKMDKN